MEHNSIKQIEQLLKKVFSVHKDTVKAANTNVNKYKQKFQRVVEKSKQLEKDVEDLTNENKNLKEAISIQTRPGSCCEVIQLCKHVLAEKDTRIRQLELHLKTLTGGSISYSSMSNKEYQLLSMTSNSDKPNVVPNHSPDKTSVNFNEKVVSISSGKIEMTPSRKANKQPDSILGEITSAIGQETVLSKITASKGNEKIHEIEDKELVVDSVTTGSFIAKRSLQKQKRIQRSKYSEEDSPEMKQWQHVSPITLSQKKIDSPCISMSIVDGLLPTSKLITSTELDCEQNINNEKHVLVKDTCDLTLYKDERSECIDTDNDVDTTDMTNNMDNNSDRNNGQEETADGVEYQFESNVVVIPETLAMGGCCYTENDISLVGDSDDDNRDTSSESCERPANACKNMKEIDDMFETPDGKVKMESKLKTHIKLPLFKKVANDSSKNTDDIILRHSLIKHKTNINQSWKKSLKTQQCCTDPTKALCGTEQERGNDVASQGHVAIESCCEGNIIIDQFARQSSVVPANDGKPISSKNIQYKKNKNEVKNDKLDVFREMGTSTIDNISDETFKSPSILHNIDGKCSNVNKDIKPDVKRNSESDSQSPFKVDKHKLIEVINIVDSPPTNKNKINIQQDLASLSTKRKSILKLSRLSNDGTSPTQDDLNRVCLVTGDKSKHEKTKGLHQLTLTQSFSSPMKIKQNKIVGGSNSDLQIAIQLSLQETKKSPDNEVVDCSSQLRNLQFNKPLPRKNCRYKTVAKLIDHVGTRDTSNIGDNVLQKVKDQSHNIQLPSGPNGSIDPAAELTHLLMESESVDVCNVDHKLVGHRLKTSTTALEESQDIPSSSTSHKFPPQRKLRNSEKQDPENRDQCEHVKILENSFDKQPKKTGPNIAHKIVVRKKDERQKLQGYSCKQCVEFYKSAGRDEAEIRDNMQKCSRHRAQYVPPETPEHFWSIGFIDTQECLDKDEKKVDDDNHGGEKGNQPYRKRRKLNKYLKSKDESP